MGTWGKSGGARARAPGRWLALWAALVGLWGCEVGVDLDTPVAPGQVELIGISGRRLADGDGYRVPLDSGREVEVGARVREAMALWNDTAEPVGITLMIVTEAARAARAWAVLAPTRAREVPWEGEVEVAPGAQLDFDVRFEPREVGPSEAWLVVGIDRRRWGERELRWIHLEGKARARDSPGGTGGR